MTLLTEQVVEKTILNIKNQFSQICADRTLVREDAVKIIETQIVNSYLQIEIDEKNTFFRILSRNLHPNKIQTKHPELYRHLGQLGLVDMPQKIINKLTSSDLINDIAIAPIKGSKRTIVFAVMLMATMLIEYKRYILPVKILINSMSWIINVGLISALSAVFFLGLIANSVLSIADRLLNLMINLITVNQLREDSQPFLMSNFEHHKFLYLDISRKKHIALLKKNKQPTAPLEQMTDKEYYDQLVEAEFKMELKKRIALQQVILYEDDLRPKAEENLRQKIVDQIPMPSMVKIKLIILSFVHAITKPVSQVESYPFFSIIFRPVQVIAAPILIFSALFLELTRYLIAAIIFLSISMATLIKCTSLAIFNMPLYVLDLYRHTKHALCEVTKSAAAADAVSNPSQNTATSARALSQLMVGGIPNVLSTPEINHSNTPTSCIIKNHCNAPIEQLIPSRNTCA